MWTLILKGVLLASLCVVPIRAHGQCLGDFNGDGEVSIEEIIASVNNSLEGCSSPNARFVDNRDGSVTDNKTGLMWEKKVTFAGLHEVNDSYPWADQCSPGGTPCQPTAAASTVCSAQVEGDATGCEQCDRTCRAADTVWTWILALNGSRFAGHTDWRVPRRFELETLLDLSRANPATDPVFNTSCEAGCTVLNCSCTQPMDYWSATTYQFVPPYAWLVDFFGGYNDANGKVGGNFYVRAVRGGS